MKLTKRKAAPGRLPVKRSINLATVDEKKLNLPASFGGIVLVIVVAALFSKFLVLDRLNELADYQLEAANLQKQVEQCNARLEELTGVENEYAHYTLEAMTEEELTRCDRIDIIELMLEKILSNHETANWSVSGNYLSVEITGEDLQHINLLVQDIEKSPIVNYCTVSRATKGVTSKQVNADGSVSNVTEEVVTASINVHLQRAQLSTEETTAEETTAEETTAEETTAEETTAEETTAEETTAEETTAEETSAEEVTTQEETTEEVKQENE